MSAVALLCFEPFRALVLLQAFIQKKIWSIEELARNRFSENETLWRMTPDARPEGREVPLRDLSPYGGREAELYAWCRENGFPNAGIRSAFPKENILAKPPRNGRHATISGVAFDEYMKNRAFPFCYRDALRLALVDGWKFKDAALLSGRSCETFERMAQRILDEVSNERFVPRDQRLQPYQFTKGFGEIGIGRCKTGWRRTAEGNREVPYDDERTDAFDSFEAAAND